MEKPAPVDHPVLDPIQRRWSPRAFDPRPVEPEKLRSALEAARWAPSSFNEQPWSLILAFRENEAAFERACACLAEPNRAWAPRAPVLFFAVARDHFERTGNANRVCVHDVGLAMAQFSIQATALGLFVHQMAGIDREAVRSTYELPPGHEPVAGGAVGYPGDPDELPEKYREAERAPRSRRALSEWVFEDGWNKPAGIVSG